MMRDPYTILGVTKSASQDDIKKAYRKLAKDLHPDRHPGDAKAAERFKDVSAAYNLLGDADQRGRFDRGEIDAAGQEKGPQGFYRGGPRQGGFEGFGGQGGQGARGFEDLFGEMFSNFRGGRQQPSRGRDRKYTLRVEFLEAARGANRRLTLPDGRKLDVRIPAGLEDGQQIRLKGQGEQGQGGQPGDALIEVTVKPHPLYERRGHDIHIELPISLDEAVLGAKIKAPTIHGDVTVSVPEGSNSGRTLRLKGKGIAGQKGKPDGDQMVRLKIVLPDGPDPELQRFVRDWQRSRSFDARAGLKTD